jgi:hypothetical protein
MIEPQTLTLAGTAAVLVLAAIEAHRSPTWREAWTVTPAGRELVRSSASHKRKRTAEALSQIAASELAAAVQLGDPNAGAWATRHGQLARKARATTARRERRHRAARTANPAAWRAVVHPEQVAR